MVNHPFRISLNGHVMVISIVVLLALGFSLKNNHEAFSTFYTLNAEERATYLSDGHIVSLLIGPGLSLLALAGLIIRNKLGWIFTAQIFYIFLIYVIVFGGYIERTPLQEISIPVGLCSGMVYLLNSKKARLYYQLKADRGLQMNLNVLVILIGLVYSIIKGYNQLN